MSNIDRSEEFLSARLDYIRRQKQPQLQVKRLTESAVLPTRGSLQAIGLDLCADLPRGPVTLYPATALMVGCGIAIAIPHGYYGRIAPRSGLAVRFGIDVLAGVIDADYRGEIMVLLEKGPYYAGALEIKHGDRIAQLILERADILDVIEVSELSETKRGVAGLGSTGVSS